MYTEKINQVTLRSNDNKRIQTFYKATTFPHRASDFKVCEEEILSARKEKVTLKILAKECENELYVTCNKFLNYTKTKGAR